MPAPCSLCADLTHAAPRASATSRRRAPASDVGADVAPTFGQSPRGEVRDPLTILPSPGPIEPACAMRHTRRSCEDRLPGGTCSGMAERLLSPREFLEECLTFKRSQPGAGRFFTSLARGDLPKDLLVLWAKDMYHFIQPGIPALTAWLSHAPTVVERDSARLVARNLAGELGFLREPDHRDLYLKMLEGIGITEPDAKEHLPLASTIGAASVLGAFCRSSFEEGLGSFGLGVELQVPGRPNGAAVIYEGLKRAGVSEDALEFYRIHVEAEEEHGDNAERALAPFVQTPQQQTLVRHAFRWTVIALSGMQRGFDAYLG
jgi:pyrroloquinoline quinone (PQQ) biosynthesis protein C